MIDVKDINKKVKSMPRHLLPEVMDYIDFLLSKYGQGATPDKESPFDFSWEGGLSDESVEHNSVELQHRASEWR